MTTSGYVVRPETMRYVEELRKTPGKASTNGHTGWGCDAGASLIAEATRPGAGTLPRIDGVIYVCSEHRADAETRITGAGYGPVVRPAPPSHRWNPWPCGHITAYAAEAAEGLARTPD